MSQPQKQRQNLSPILNALSSSLSSSSVTQEEGHWKTLEDFLLKSTQHIPAKSVEKLLAMEGKENNHDTKNGDQSDSLNSSLIKLDKSTLRIAYGQVLTEPLDRIRSSVSSPPPDSSSSVTTLTTSTLHQALEDWILVFSFLQLLLEIFANVQKEKKSQLPVASVARHAEVSAKDVQEMITQLLRSLAGVVCKSLDQHKQQLQLKASEDDTMVTEEEEDAEAFYQRIFRNQGNGILTKEETTSTDTDFYSPRVTAIFVWQFLLRVSNTYIPILPKFLAPFWKTLSEMTTALQPLFPPTLSIEALKALLYFVRQGSWNLLQTLVADTLKHPQLSYSSALNTNSNLLTLCLKTLNFFLNRINFFLNRVSSTAGATSDHKFHRLCHHLIEQLALLQGLERLCFQDPKREADRTDQGECSSPSYLDLTTAVGKAQRCFDSLYCNQLGIAVVEKSMVVPCPQSVWENGWIKHVENEARNDQNDAVFVAVKELAFHATSLGNTSFLIQTIARVLSSSFKDDDTSTTGDDIDDTERNLLLLCRAVLFQGLPVCLTVQQQQEPETSAGCSFGCCDRLVAKTMTVLNQALRFLLKTRSERREREHVHRIYRLLVSWLGSASSSDKGHPLTVQVLTCVTLNTILLCNSSDVETDSIQNAYDFGQLLIHLLMDGRTVQPLRITAAAVLRRFLLHGSGSEEGTMDNEDEPSIERVKQQVYQGLARRVEQLAQAWQSYKKKRKRNHINARSHPASMQPNLLLPNDLQIVGQVLLLVPSNHFRLDKRDNHDQELSQSRDLLLATLGVYCNQYSSPPSVFFDVCSSSSKMNSASTSPRRATALEALTIALFQHRASKESQNNPLSMNALTNPPTPSMSNSELESLLGLMSHVTGSRTEGGQKKAALVSATFALASMARVMPPNPNVYLLDRLAQIFQQVFLSSFSSLRHKLVVSALCRFSSQVSDKYKHKLPSFLPSKSKANVQARLRKKTHIPPSSLMRKGHEKQDPIEFLAVLHRRYHQRLSLLGQPIMEELRRTGGSCAPLFPKPSSLAIQNGSFVLSLPTQDGRKATVIFPPCPESLADIAYMMGDCGGDDDEAAAATSIFQLVRPVLLEQEGTTVGCKFLLREHSHR